LKICSKKVEEEMKNQGKRERKFREKINKEQNIKIQDLL